MFAATKRALTLAAVIAAASPASAAYAKFELNPSPRGVAIVSGQALTVAPGVRSDADQQTAQTSVPFGSSPGVRPPALFGGAGPLYPGTSVTHYPGVVPSVGQSAQHHGAQTASAGGGFDWGDGAIGALVVLGVMAVGFGAIVLVRRRTNTFAGIQS